MKKVRQEESNENQMVECHYNGSIIMVPKDRFIALVEAQPQEDAKVKCLYKGIVMYISVKTFHSIVARMQFDNKKFTRYKEGAQIYGMSEREFFEFARDANAIYKRNRMALVNIELLDKYLESCQKSMGMKIPKTAKPDKAYDINQTVECHFDGAVVHVPVNIFVSMTMGVSLDEKKFVRYKDGAKIYGMGMTEFFQLAHDADAVYKRNKMALINLEILDNFMEFFHEKGV